MQKLVVFVVMFEVGSTVENMEVEICSQCHPFIQEKEVLTK